MAFAAHRYKKGDLIMWVRGGQVSPVTKVATKSRGKQGKTVSRYELHYRMYDEDGTASPRKRRFDRVADAQAFADRLREANAGVVWTFDAQGDPVLAVAGPSDAPTGPTLYELAHRYWLARYRTLSPADRKSTAVVIRAILAETVEEAGTPPGSTVAYLHAVALRTAEELSDGQLPDTIKYQGVQYDRAALADGRLWLRENSMCAMQRSREDAQAMLIRVVGSNGASTEGRRWSAFRPFLRWLYEAEHTAKDLRVGLRARTSAETGEGSEFDAERTPTVEEMWELADVCHAIDARWKSLVVTLGGAGLRIGEAAALRRRHIEDDTDTAGIWITVKKSWASSSGWGEVHEQERGTKAKGSTGNLRGRVTFLPPAEAAVLRTHLTTLDAGADTLIWTTYEDKQMHTDWLHRNVWATAREQAFPAPHRLEEINRHDFRHLACTRWLRAGVALKTAQKWSGHKTLSVFLDVYQAALPSDDGAGAALMADA